jgi:hypothetical protein
LVPREIITIGLLLKDSLSSCSSENFPFFFFGGPEYSLSLNVVHDSLGLLFVLILELLDRVLTVKIKDLFTDWEPFRAINPIDSRTSSNFSCPGFFPFLYGPVCPRIKYSSDYNNRDDVSQVCFRSIFTCIDLREDGTWFGNLSGVSFCDVAIVAKSESIPSKILHPIIENEWRFVHRNPFTIGDESPRFDFGNIIISKSHHW